MKAWLNYSSFLIRNLKVFWLESGQTDPLTLPAAHVLVFIEAHNLCVGNWPAVRGRPSPTLNVYIYKSAGGLSLGLLDTSQRPPDKL